MPAATTKLATVIELAPCAEEHRWLLHTWRNTRDVARFMYRDEPIAAADHDRWYSALLADDQRRGWVVTDDGTPIGAAFIADYAPEHRRASFGLYIAEPVRRGGGAGRAALCLVCEYALDQLGLHKLIGEALAFNAAAITLYGRLGFRQEGVLRDHLHRDGHWVDVHLMALFEDDQDELRRSAAELRQQARIA